MGFYLALLLARYFSVFSFCLIYSIFSLHSPGCMVVAPLASVFCPSGEVGQVPCLGFLMGRTAACILVGGAESFPSGEQGHVKLCFGESVSLV